MSKINNFSKPNHILKVLIRQPSCERWINFNNFLNILLRQLSCERWIFKTKVISQIVTKEKIPNWTRCICVIRSFRTCHIQKYRSAERVVCSCLHSWSGTVKKKQHSKVDGCILKFILWWISTKLGLRHPKNFGLNLDIS